MVKEINDTSFITWLEDIWEEIKIQFYGIIGAIFFLVLVDVFFQPV